jgi:hypothetical protein
MSHPRFELITPIGAVLVICASLASIFLGPHSRLRRKTEVPTTRSTGAVLEHNARWFVKAASLLKDLQGQKKQLELP